MVQSSSSKGRRGEGVQIDAVGVGRDNMVGR
jgi:hypothetical protein